MFEYCLRVFKKDRRFKSGERFVQSYIYSQTSAQWMAEEVSHLRRSLYRREDGWRLDYHPTTEWVTNLQTGKLVEIDYNSVGTAQDPSQERYWSL